MLDWLFEPLYYMQSCYGETIGELTCHTEATSYMTAPLFLIAVPTFLVTLISLEKISEKRRLKREAKEKWR